MPTQRDEPDSAAVEDGLRPSSIFRDVAGVFGAFLVFAGVYQIYPPAAFIAVGAALVAFAFLSAVAEARKKPE